MQNKPNLPNDQTNVTSFITKDYENKSLRRPSQNKPNSNPIKPNLPNAQINVSSFITNHYENIHLLERRKNKANSNPTCRGVASGEAGSNPIPQRDTQYDRSLPARGGQYDIRQEFTRSRRAIRDMRYKPNQTQTKPISNPPF